MEWIRLTCVQVLTFSLTINMLCLLGLMSENLQLISLLLIAIFLSFYKFNRISASIFLGDVGSIPIGYILGFLFIYTFLKDGPIIPLLIVSLYYLFDSTLTLIIRLFKGKIFLKRTVIIFTKRFLELVKRISKC